MTPSTPIHKVVIEPDTPDEQQEETTIYREEQILPNTPPAVLKRRDTNPILTRHNLEEHAKCSISPAINSSDRTSVTTRELKRESRVIHVESDSDEEPVESHVSNRRVIHADTRPIRISAHRTPKLESVDGETRILSSQSPRRIATEMDCAPAPSTVRRITSTDEPLLKRTSTSSNASATLLKPKVVRYSTESQPVAASNGMAVLSLEPRWTHCPVRRTTGVAARQYTAERPQSSELVRRTTLVSTPPDTQPTQPSTRFIRTATAPQDTFRVETVPIHEYMNTPNSGVSIRTFSPTFDTYTRARGKTHRTLIETRTLEEVCSVDHIPTSIHMLEDRPMLQILVYLSHHEILRARLINRVFDRFITDQRTQRDLCLADHEVLHLNIYERDIYPNADGFASLNCLFPRLLPYDRMVEHYVEESKGSSRSRTIEKHAQRVSLLAKVYDHQPDDETMFQMVILKHKTDLLDVTYDLVRENAGHVLILNATGISEGALREYFVDPTGRLRIIQLPKFKTDVEVFEHQLREACVYEALHRALRICVRKTMQQRETLLMPYKEYIVVRKDHTNRRTHEHKVEQMKKEKRGYMALPKRIPFPYRKRGTLPRFIRDDLKSRKTKFSKKKRFKRFLSRHFHRTFGTRNYHFKKRPKTLVVEDRVRAKDVVEEKTVVAEAPAVKKTIVEEAPAVKKTIVEEKPAAVEGVRVEERPVVRRAVAVEEPAVERARVVRRESVEIASPVSGEAVVVKRPAPVVERVVQEPVVERKEVVRRTVAARKPPVIVKENVKEKLETHPRMVTERNGRMLAESPSGRVVTKNVELVPERRRLVV